MKVELQHLLPLMKILLFFVLTWLSSVSLYANVQVGDRQAGRDETEAVVVHRCNSDRDCYEYVSYHEGSATGWPPVILSAPHGGHLRPSTIPDRDVGCWEPQLSKCVWSHTCGVKNITACKAITEDDYATYDLALEIRSRMCTLFNGRCPALVLNNLLRIKFDANREKPEATFGVPEVEVAFEKYQEYIENTKANIVRRHGVGLFIDMHGQGHKIQRAELGYLLRANDLDSGQVLHDPNRTSIRSLSIRHPEIDFDDLLRGDSSFGAYLENFGFQAVPSPTSRGPGAGNPYFNGGYLTRRHGSKDGGTIDAIQIESARSPREPVTRRHYAHSVAQAIARYVCRYYVALPSELIGEQPETVAADCRRIANGQFRIRPANYVALAALVAVASSLYLSC